MNNYIIILLLLAIGLLIGIVGLLMKEPNDRDTELEKWLLSQEEKKEGE
ncbi:MAG: hypothetical protein HY096_00445 [Nitrospinae bacterium]|nr:hypothetical protein [Nitrospinota bacterium]